MVSEVFDTELIGEGAIATFAHAHRHLLEVRAINGVGCAHRDEEDVKVWHRDGEDVKVWHRDGEDVKVWHRDGEDVKVWWT